VLSVTWYARVEGAGGLSESDRLGLLVVRPHGERVRERVLSLLGRAGIRTLGAEVLPAGTPDGRALAAIRARAPLALLIPLHAHRTAEGELVNGIQLAERIDSELPAVASVPIFMPASAFGMSTLELAMARDQDAGGPSDALRRRLIPIPIETRSMSRACSRHCAPGWSR